MDRAERPGDGRKGDEKGHRGGGSEDQLGVHTSPCVPSGAMLFTPVVPSSLGSVYASRPALSSCCFFIDCCFYFYLLSVLGLRGCTRPFPSCAEQGLLFMAVCGLLAVADCRL